MGRYYWIFSNHMGIFMANQNFDSVEAQASYGIATSWAIIRVRARRFSAKCNLAGLVDF